MRKSWALVVVVVLGACAAGAKAGTTVYNSSNDFTSQLQPGYYQEDFNGLVGPGHEGDLIPQKQTYNGILSASFGPVNGYDFTLSSTQYPPLPFSPPQGLYSLDGAVAVNDNWNGLVVTFPDPATGGRPVYAVGGNFYCAEYPDLNYHAAHMTLKLDDGTVQTFNFTNQASTDFTGVFSTVPIDSITLRWDPTGWTGNDVAPFPTMSSLVIGAPAAGGSPPIPEPLTMFSGALAVGALGAWLRRAYRCQTAA